MYEFRPDVDTYSRCLHLEGLYSAYVSTCPSSSESSSSASSSSSGGDWVLWAWLHQRDNSNVIHMKSGSYISCFKRGKDKRLQLKDRRAVTTKYWHHKQSCDQHGKSTSMTTHSIERYMKPAETSWNWIIKIVYACLLQKTNELCILSLIISSRNWKPVSVRGFLYSYYVKKSKYYTCSVWYDHHNAGCNIKQYFHYLWW